MGVYVIKPFIIRYQNFLEFNAWTIKYAIRFSLNIFVISKFAQ